MTEAKHTPGPWKAVSNSFGSQFVYGSVERVAPTGTKYNDLVCGGENPSLLTEGDARLIAAAPDMLEALQGLVYGVIAEVNEKGGGGFVLARLRDAQDAIAKATGGT